MDHSHPGGLTREHVVWAYRLLLDRDPESEDVIGPKLAGSRDTRELRNHLITSAEYREKNPDFAHTNDRTVVIAELEGGVRLFVDLSDHVIGLNIVRGGYEREEIAYVRSVLRPGDHAIDIGAHIGYFTVQMAAMVGGDGRVVAFEPLDSNADLLERSIRENGFGQRVLLYRGAAAAANGEATLTFPPETLNSGGAYVLRPGTAPLHGNLVAPVRTFALDGIELPHPIRFIKMDAPEPLVIRGAEQLLRADRPIVLSELHPTQLERAAGTSAEGYLAQMRALGYRARTIAGEAIDRAPDRALASVLFVPAD